MHVRDREEGFFVKEVQVQNKIRTKEEMWKLHREKTG